MDQQEAREDHLVDWLLRAFTGTREIHDVTPQRSEAEDPFAKRRLVAVNEDVQAPRVHKRDDLNLLLYFVPVATWERARRGEQRLPREFDGDPVRSWPRTSQHDDATTCVRQLTLTNFRCFQEMRVSFREGMNVLVGRNGAGKTAILDAIAAGLAGGVRPLYPDLGSAFLETSMDLRDVRVARIEKGGITTLEKQLPARIRADMQIHGVPVQSGPVAESFGTGGVATGPGQAISFLDFSDVLRWAVQDGFDTTLPLVAYYGAGRTFRNGKPRDTGRDDLSRLSAYEGCLEPSTSLSAMRSWFRRMELLALQDGRPPPVLEACKRALATCLGGFFNVVRYDARIDDIAAESTDTGLLLAFGQLSDGQRNVLGMVADMAYRAANLNPHLGGDAAERTPGVVLIDELDLHLHPAWQRRVARDLRRAFPRVQFIVTTHSPQVLSDVPSDSIIVLEDFQSYSSAANTEGRDTNSILSEVLGVPARPDETVEELDAISHMIDEGKLAEARERLDQLAERLTQRDPEVGRLQTILDVAERIDASDPEGH